MSRQPVVVADIMTANPITLNEEDSLSSLDEEMHNLGLRHIPVVDGKKFVGLVTQRDLLEHTMSALHRGAAGADIEQRDKQERFVADIMTREVSTVRPQTPLAQAAEMIVTGKLGCLPVVTDDGNLAGVVTESDFVRLLLQLLPRARTPQASPAL